MAHGLISYFRCVDNINKLKEIVVYQLRYSLIYTLMHKHKLSSVRAILKIYGKNLQSVQKNSKTDYVNLVKVKQMKSKFLIKPIANTYININKIF